MAQETFTAVHINSTRANFAIKSGVAVKKILGVPTVKIEAIKAQADGQCCGVPYATEYISSAGSSVHVWCAGEDYLLMERVVRTLLYWKDVAMLTWSHGEPAGYRTCFKLNEPENWQNKQKLKVRPEAEID